MYFFNKLEPKQICENAIHILKKEQKRILKEVEEVRKWEDKIKAYYKKQELGHTYFEYSRIISGLEKVEQYVCEKMYQDYPYLVQMIPFFGGLDLGKPN